MTTAENADVILYTLPRARVLLNSAFEQPCDNLVITFSPVLPVFGVRSRLNLAKTLGMARISLYHFTLPRLGSTVRIRSPAPNLIIKLGTYGQGRESGLFLSGLGHHRATNELAG